MDRCDEYRYCVSNFLRWNHKLFHFITSSSVETLHMHVHWLSYSKLLKGLNNKLGYQKKVFQKMKPPCLHKFHFKKHVYDAAIQMGSAIRSRGVNPGDRCGIYGSNCLKWIIALEACNSQAITYVPLYDSLGANAVEFIINHAEVSIAFVQENKIPAVNISCLPNCLIHLKTIVSFTNVSSTQKKEAEDLGVSCFSWEEFSQLGNSNCELPPKQRTVVCTIMYTCGTTGEPKGVIVTDAALMSEVLSTYHILFLTDRVVNNLTQLTSSIF